MSKTQAVNVEKSAQIAKGYHFEFIQGDNIIRAVGSAVSGKEQVFCNNQLVAKKRSLGIKSRLPFELNDSQYEVEFKATNFFTGEIQCSLIKDGLLIEVLKQTIEEKYQITGRTKILFIISQVAFVGFILNWALNSFT